MEKMKKAIYLALHMSICNFRCDYCYLSQRETKFDGRQIDWKITPDFVKKHIRENGWAGCVILIYVQMERRYL